jgi:YidC/Oxa1 family membrane protein insertase
MQQRNFLLFFVLSFLLFIGWLELKRALWPPPPKDETAEVKKSADAPEKRPDKPPEKSPEKPPERPPEWPVTVAETPADRLHTLGSADAASPYHLRVLLDPRGASVRSVLLNKFQAADERGRPTSEPLELIPEDANRTNPSYLLFHFKEGKDPGKGDDAPLNTLGLVEWEVVEPPVEEKLSDGRTQQRISFRTKKPVQGVEITKTYTLTERDYHLGLEVKLERKDAWGDNTFRYQLTGGHGLPIEGKWYTGTFRNALIARVDNGSVTRDLQDLRQIALWEGGADVIRDGNKLLQYAGVAIQYFASVIVVDDQQKATDFLHQARPTLETSVTKGVIKSIDQGSLATFGASSIGLMGAPLGQGPLLAASAAFPGRAYKSFALTVDNKERFFFVTESSALWDTLSAHKPGDRVAVIHHTDPNGVPIATEIGDHDSTQPLWIDDITVRVATEPQDLKPNKPVTHKYLLYNGPVKPMLLGLVRGDAEVPSEVVERYVDTLHLNTLTDYHSPGWMGSFASFIGWTKLVIFFTNLLHWVLAKLYVLLPSHGLCIVLLTVLVRSLMFPLSRKQALVGIKMQALAPELKKLQEKHKDDRQALGMAQMELYRKHGVNPFGTCWLMLLQMPIFMGLYFCLQESIQFRLAAFWPWITNLAAPDMLWEWGERIPFISRPEDYGGFLYLGPYLNLLPVIAVALMIAQQKMMTPPPTDEQQEMQQKIMKYMMVFIGLMFYKVAAGLCIYFIASSVWGFAERKLLPRRDLAPGAATTEAAAPRPTARPTGDGITTSPVPSTTSFTAASPKAGKGNRAKRRQDRAVRGSESSASGGTSLLSRLREWWAEVRRQAEKKER